MHPCMHTLIKKRNDYISRYVIDVNYSDRYAESTFSTHISVEVSDENISHITVNKKCLKKHLQ